MICLDEPTAGVAQREAEAFGPLILRIKEELDATLVVVEHDLPLILSISDRVYCLEAGRVIAEGLPGAVRDDPARRRVVPRYRRPRHPAQQRRRVSGELVHSKKERSMAKYLALFSYSGDAMAAMIERPAERETRGSSRARERRWPARALYWMFGTHDGIAIVDAPDSLTMAGISAAVSSTGTISSETHELFTGEDVERILDIAQRARGHFAPPGQSA